MLGCMCVCAFVRSESPSGSVHGVCIAFALRYIFFSGLVEGLTGPALTVRCYYAMF